MEGGESGGSFQSTGDKAMSKERFVEQICGGA